MVFSPASINNHRKPQENTLNPRISSAKENEDWFSKTQHTQNKTKMEKSNPERIWGKPNNPTWKSDQNSKDPLTHI